MGDGETILISKEEYERLQKQNRWILALEAAGYDNWTGYGIAQDIFEERGTEDG